MINLERKVEQVMDHTIRVFFGRTFSSEDIELIRWTKNKYPKLSRVELAKTLCEFWDWTTPAGLPKRVQCVAFLEKLEAEGVITLPPKRQKKPSSPEAQKQENEEKHPYIELKGSVKDYERIYLEIARQGTGLKRWKSYVDKYHMLGEKAVYGCRLQYFIKSGYTELGCMQFSASSWALKGRDEWIGWKVDDRKARLNLIVNNSRFLILPCGCISYCSSPFTSLNYLSA